MVDRFELIRMEIYNVGLELGRLKRENKTSPRSLSRKIGDLGLRLKQLLGRFNMFGKRVDVISIDFYLDEKNLRVYLTDCTEQEAYSWLGYNYSYATNIKIIKLPLGEAIKV